MVAVVVVAVVVVVIELGDILEFFTVAEKARQL
jgi:hypothetical protein